MATLSKTFSVKSGIDVANTVVIDSNRNISNIQTLNVTTVNANTFVTGAGSPIPGTDLFTLGNTANATANLAYAQANTAQTTAQNAYGVANTSGTNALNAYGAANSAANTVRVSANGGSTLSGKQLNFINTASIQVIVASSGDGTNANISFTTSGASVGDAYVQANSAYSQANAAYETANTANTTGKNAYSQANTAQTTAQNAYGAANSAQSTAGSAASDATQALTDSHNAYAAANTAANTVRVSANSGSTLSSKQLNFVNTATAQITVTDSGNGNANIIVDVIGGGAIGQAYAQANAAYDAANTANTNALNAYAAANTANTNALNAYGQANNAYLAANNSNLKAGGTITGDLQVTGNIFLGTGNVTYVNVSSLAVNDSIIQLSTNSTSDTLDIGFVGHYSSSNYHTGLIRHAADQKYYLFDGYGLDPTNNIIDISGANTATLVANLQANSITLGGQTVATQANLTIAHNQANAAYGQANAAYDTANTANTIGKNAYAQANTAQTTAQNSYDKANTAATDALNAYAGANTANTNALNAYAAANNRVLKAGDTMTGGLTITTSGIGLSVANANVTYSLQVGTLNVTTNTVTTAAAGQVVLDKFPATQLASVKYFIQANSATNYHTTEIVLVQDATNVWVTEYGSLYTGDSLGTFTADISSGDVRLLFTAVNNINTIRSVRYGITP